MLPLDGFGDGAVFGIYSSLKVSNWPTYKHCHCMLVFQLSLNVFKVQKILNAFLNMLEGRGFPRTGRMKPIPIMI